MLPHLNAAQNRQLRKVLRTACSMNRLSQPLISSRTTLTSIDSVGKEAGRLLERTISYYESTIRKLLEAVNEPAVTLKTEKSGHISLDYQRHGNVSRTTVDNVRRIISSFYSWLEDEDQSSRAPSESKKVKAPQTRRVDLQ